VGGHVVVRDLPCDLAVSSRSEVFVGEVLDANRIQKFSPGCGNPAQRPAPVE